MLAALEADGVALHPSPAALVFAQDKLAMRGGSPRSASPARDGRRSMDAASLKAFGDEVGWPVVVKTPRGGYDGKGVRVVASADEAEDWLEVVARHAAAGEGLLAEGLLAEERVDFVRELAVLVARSPSGQAAAWPVVETVQTDGICTEVLAPAPGLDEDFAAQATEAALRIAGDLGVTGVLAVELFEVRDPRTGDSAYVVNELAMRPHNSGHWTHRRRGHQPVRAAPACRARPAAGRPRPRASRGRSWATCSAATTPSSTRPTGTCWRATPG